MFYLLCRVLFEDYCRGTIDVNEYINGIEKLGKLREQGKIK